MPALPPNSLIAITGVSGYIASYTGLWALRAGHRVRGTVRSMARAESLKAGYEKHGIPADELNKRLEFVIVDDLSSEEQWTNAFENVDGVLHAAMSRDDLSDPQLIPVTVAATLSLLRAAKKIPSIKRVVFVSTLWSIRIPPMHSDRVLTARDWNDEVLNIFENNLPVDHDPMLKRASHFFPYTVAKIKVERAAWEFVKETSFDLVATLPGTTMGPMLHGELASTPRMAAAGLRNDTTAAKYLPNQWFVDVRDCGRLLFLALTTPSMGGKRYLAVAEAFDWNQVYGIYRKNFPKAQVLEDLEGCERWRQKLDFSESTEMLGGWISLEQSLVDLGKSLGY
ncbi:hypothetical protein JB92DRAFT_2963251 [Gautieria morchelliformis]|nr:hypothetical protein JB92DRAFT_2963251 [Gautieria morchelliformis]